MDWIEILGYAGYNEKAECLARAFAAANITTLLQLENSVGKLGHICQCDIYQVVAAVNRVFSEGLPVEAEESAESEVEAEPEEFDVGED